MNKKIYISGKITGIEYEAIALFAAAEQRLQNAGYQPVNPMKLNHEHDKSWHSYMRKDIQALCECDGIFMLANWSDSKGAIIEHTIASYLGMQVYYEQQQLLLDEKPETGMQLRDQFAMNVIPVLIQENGQLKHRFRGCKNILFDDCQLAYEIADAMRSARRLE